MEYSHFSILLLLLSLALLVSEVFVPSGGFIAVLMLVSLAGSIFCAFRAWWETSPTLWWTYVASVLVLLPGVLIAAFTIFPRTSYGRRVLLDAPAPEEITPYAKEQAELQKLVGRRGKTVTPHTPGGIVSVDGRRYHSETRGLMLDPGEEIEVVAVRGNRVVVRLADAPPPPSAPLEQLAADESPAPPASGQPPEPRPDDLFDPFLDEPGKA
ncbi:MAG TPA: NfeD family protein [Planctomycetaceae bacterium]